LEEGRTQLNWGARDSRKDKMGRVKKIRGKKRETPSKKERTVSPPEISLKTGDLVSSEGKH